MRAADMPSVNAAVTAAPKIRSRLTNTFCQPLVNSDSCMSAPVEITLTVRYSPSGSDLAWRARSASDFTGNAGFSTSTNGTPATSATGTRSFVGSYGSFL